MIIDTQVHYMQPESDERPYDHTGIPQEVLSFEQAILEAQRVGIDAIVHTAPSIMGFDNRYALEGFAKSGDRVLGVFGRFDPFAPDLPDRLRAFMRQPGMMGVRQSMLTPPTRFWLPDRQLDYLFAVMESQDVPVALFAPYQTKDIREVAQRFRGLRIHLDHMGVGREERDDQYLAWNELIELAREPNVWVKVSYFPQSAPPGEVYPFPTARARFEALYNAVGPHKLIWGSNYPSVKKVCTYRQALTFVTEECPFLSPSDLEIVLGGAFLSSMRIRSSR